MTREWEPSSPEGNPPRYAFRIALAEGTHRRVVAVVARYRDTPAEPAPEGWALGPERAPFVPAFVQAVSAGCFHTEAGLGVARILHSARTAEKGFVVERWEVELPALAVEVFAVLGRMADQSAWMGEGLESFEVEERGGGERARVTTLSLPALPAPAVAFSVSNEFEGDADPVAIVVRFAGPPDEATIADVSERCRGWGAAFAAGGFRGDPFPGSQGWLAEPAMIADDELVVKVNQANAADDDAWDALLRALHHAHLGGACIASVAIG